MIHPWIVDEIGCDIKKIIRINFFQKKEKKVGRARLTKNWHKILIEETNVEGESKT